MLSSVPEHFTRCLEGLFACWLVDFPCPCVSCMNNSWRSKAFAENNHEELLAQILPSILCSVLNIITAGNHKVGVGVHTNICRTVKRTALWKAGKASEVVFKGNILLSGAGARSCVSPHAQPDSAGHAADGGGADPDCTAHRPHPAPAQRSLRPRQRRLREENPRVSPGTGGVGCCPGKPDLGTLALLYCQGL